MKKILLLSVVVLLSFGSFAQQLSLDGARIVAAVKETAPAFVWEESVFDFGKIKLGEPVTHEFEFTNSGQEPLVISSVKASCGCTVTAYTKDPVPAGGTGFVKATYNAARAGQFSKTVTVVANTSEGSVLLTIKGEVVE